MPQPFADEFKSIPMSSNLGESLERARGFAREQAHRAVMLEHLLLAFTEDPDAAAVLQASNVDLLRLGTDVSGYLGRLLEDMRAENGAEPHADPELLRVLQAAGQAAQQSRRRQIDGAIVLAAVVGDGKSPAAGLLKAHGLTFEEAIRALQKANAKANAQERSKQFATPPPAAPVVPAPSPSPAAENIAPAAQHESPAPAASAGPQVAGQSVEEILAAARARIQQRTSTLVTKTPAKAPPAEQHPAAPEPLPLSSLTSAPAPPAPPPPEFDDDFAEELPPQPPPAAPAPNLPPPAPQGRPGWTPPPTAPPQPAARLPQQRAAAPFPQRPLQPGDGPARPPLPHRANSGGPHPPPGFPNRPARAPWPDPGEPTAPPPPRPLPTNGALADAAPPVARPRSGQRTGGQGGQGPLMETIPRRMRLGVATTAQVRINRDKIDGLILLLLNGRGMAHRPDAFLTRALTVRLRAPDGGFWIEAISPETQWVESAPGLQQDEYAGWRWTVTPQRRGRGKLLLLVTARTVGRDGLAAETAPPDRVIEVTVKGGHLRSFSRLGGLVVALLLGVALGRFGNELWAIGAAVFKKFVGG